MKFPVLGFLIDRPMHGYELKRALSPALPPAQRINDGVLYPLLKRMEADGLIRKRVERGGKAPDRHVFHPTELGRRAFDEWLRGTEDERDDVKYDFLLGHPFLTKCLFFDSLTPAQALAKLETQLADSLEKLATFESIRKGMVARGVARNRVAVLELGIAQQKEKVRWLRRLIKELEQRRRSDKAA
jgi:DNA-binding PadR family transcriptional regulator